MKTDICARSWGPVVSIKIHNSRSTPNIRLKYVLELWEEMNLLISDIYIQT